MPAITPTQVAMGLGAAGAMVDVTSYVEAQEPITHSWGKEDEFRDTPPGMIAFTLNNRDGRFTPGNTASPYATTVTEGMTVSWILGSRLKSATIRQILPAATEQTWGEIRIVCDDQLGSSSRRSIGNLVDAWYAAAGGQAQWLLADASNPLTERSGGVPFNGNYGPTDPLTFGVTTSHIPGVSAALLMTWNDVTSPPQIEVLNPVVSSSAYGGTTMGSWGFWVEGLDIGTKPGWGFTAWWDGFSPSSVLTITANSGKILMRAGTGATIVNGPNTVDGVAQWVEVTSSTVFAAGVWTVSFSLYVDGVYYGTSTYVATTITSLPDSKRAPIRATLTQGGVAGQPCSAYVARIAYSIGALNEAPIRNFPATTEAKWLPVIAATAPEIALDTLPADLSAQPIVAQTDLNGSALLSAFNDVLRTEQGDMWAATTGTLLAPVQKIKVRARNRPTTVTATFNAQTELQGVPEFVRSVTDTVSSVSSGSTGQTVTATDPTLFPRVGSANTSETVLNTTYSDLLNYGQDRIIRGANTQMKLPSILIDALTTPTDRTADIFALVPGDRIRITNLPSDVLGFTTWEGWFRGMSESHRTGNQAENLFRLFLQPVLPRTAIFDTDRFMADGALTLSTAIVSTSATTMSVATTGPKMETVDVPYDLLIDSEQVTVTACTGATPQVATITRGVNGTTAATHTTAATIELATPALFAF